MVSDDHINILVSYFSSRTYGQGLWLAIGENYDYYDYLTPQKAGALGLLLHKANVKSCNQRYQTNMDHDYKFDYILDTNRNYTIAEIAGGLNCLEYQCNEADGFDESLASQIIGRMRKQLLQQLRDLEGFDNWELELNKEAQLA